MSAPTEDVVMVFANSYGPPRPQDTSRRDKLGHYLGCVAGMGCIACQCGDHLITARREDFFWMTEGRAEAILGKHRYDRDAAAYAELATAKRVRGRGGVI